MVQEAMPALFFLHEKSVLEHGNVLRKADIKCADLNRYTFSLQKIEEKVYLFKSAHFKSISRLIPYLQF